MAPIIYTTSILSLSPIIEQNFALKIQQLIGRIAIEKLFGSQHFNSEQDDALYQVKGEYDGKEVLADLHIIYQQTPVMDADLKEIIFKHKLLANERKKRMDAPRKNLSPLISHSRKIPIVSVFLHKGYHERSYQHKSGLNQFLYCQTLSIIDYKNGSGSLRKKRQYIGASTPKIIYLNLKYFEMNRKDGRKIKVEPDVYQFLLLNSNFDAFKAEFPAEDMIHEKILDLYNKKSKKKQFTQCESEFTSTLTELISHSVQNREIPQTLNILKKALIEIKRQNSVGSCKYQ